MRVEIEDIKYTTETAGNIIGIYDINEKNFYPLAGFGRRGKSLLIKDEGGSIKEYDLNMYKIQGSGRLKIRAACGEQKGNSEGIILVLEKQRTTVERLDAFFRNLFNID